MASNLRELFDMAKTAKRKTPSQKQFEKENLALLLEFKNIVFESFETLQDQLLPLVKTGGGMDNKFPSISIISLIRSKIIERFPLYCGKATKSRFKLVTPTQSNVYVKKLNERKRPLNRFSKANELILCQLTRSNEDKGGNVFLGYTCDREYFQILGIYAVCLDGKVIVWDINILNLAEKHEAKIIRMKKKGDRVKLKPNAKKLDTDNEINKLE